MWWFRRDLVLLCLGWLLMVWWFASVDKWLIAVAWVTAINSVGHVMLVVV